MNEEYMDYLIDNCTCEVNEDCDCMTFEQFEEKQIQALEAYWERMAEDYEEEHDGTNE